jgi:hypothetical protein
MGVGVGVAGEGGGGLVAGSEGFFLPSPEDGRCLLSRDALRQIQPRLLLAQQDS